MVSKTDDVMTESESGGKLMKQLVKTGRETVMEEEGTAVCQRWGYIMVGAEVHSPNS